MTILAEERQKTITDNRRHDSDTGSPEVQISLLTQQIQNLTEHMKVNRHDYASRRGLVMAVGKRNRLLRYIARKDRDAYQALIKRLGLRK